MVPDSPQPARQKILDGFLDILRGHAQDGAGVRLPFSNVHVLLVEDNPVNHMVAAAMLEKFGCHVVHAATGDEVMKQLQQRSFDLILMDCQIPVMDGYETARAMRAMEARQQRPRTPIIAFTAHTMKADNGKCTAAGMDDYIPKPFRPNDLERILTTWVAKDQPRTKEAATGEATMATVPILDAGILAAAKDLLGNSFFTILRHYIAASKESVAVMRDALARGDRMAIARAAHPLKSSSKQVGALRVARFAEEIEALASIEAPDMDRLTSLLQNMEQASTETERALAPHLGDVH